MADGTALTTSAGTPGERIVALDALRGVAVAGIVPINVIVFALPAAAYVNPRAYGAEGPLDHLLWLVGFLVVEDKFRALFAMMFGAGVAMLLARETPHPERGHGARMAVLFGIGMVHATLLAGNEILRVYAVAGLILPLVMRMKPRALHALAALIVAGQVLALAWYFREWFAYWWQVQAGTADAGAMQQLEAAYGADPAAVAEALERGRMGFVERLHYRLGIEPALTLRVMAGLPSSLAAMLVGIGLWRGGLLAGEWERARALRLAGIMAALSLPALAAMAAADLASGFDPLVVPTVALIVSAPFDILLAVGWAALAMALFGKSSVDEAKERVAWPTRLWAATGRMALTNYLATSLVLSAIFAGWGLGLFGEVSRSGALALGCVPIALMLGWSPWWLARFRQGPAEWLWRSLASGRPLPFRRSEARERG